jgi:hypothetical protein
MAMAEWRRALVLLWMPLALIGLSVLAQRGPIRAAPDNTQLIYENESAYNYIQVARWGEANILFLNEGQGIHSMIYPDYPDFITTGGTWDYYLAAPFFNAPPYTLDDVKSLALVGLAGGTIAKQYTHVFGPILIDGMEIDPRIVEVGRDYFQMDEENLNVIVQDGRYALAASENSYDVIGVDAYRLPYIPWNLTTVEFFQSARDHLSERGVVAINVGRTVDDRRLIEALGATLLTVFPSVHVIDVPGSCNSIVVATNQPTDPDNLLANRDRLPPDTHPLLLEVLTSAHEQLRDDPLDGPVFTDDRAGIEVLAAELAGRYPAPAYHDTAAAAAGLDQRPAADE